MKAESKSECIVDSNGTKSRYLDENDDYKYHPLVEKILNVEYPIVEKLPNPCNFSYSYRFSNGENRILITSNEFFNDYWQREYFLSSKDGRVEIPERDYQAAVTMYKIIK